MSPSPARLAGRARRFRPTLALAAGGLLLTGLPAVAGQTGACPLITDVAGDQSLTGDPARPDTTAGARALDIRSADLAGDARHVVVTIRVTDIGDRDTAPVGHYYALTFQTETKGFTVSADLSADGNDFMITSGDLVNGEAPSQSWLADVAGTVDLRHNALRMTIPRKLLNQNGAGGWITHLTAEAGRQFQNMKVSTAGVSIGHGGLIPIEDTAATTHRYRVGDPGCGS